MTCFWTAIVSHLCIEDMRLLGLEKKPSLGIFIQTLKNKNRNIENILWQGYKIRDQEKKEHFEAVRDYNIGGIHNGHLTSVCDSFLLLLAELLQLRIEHRYLNTDIIYNHPNYRKTLRFRSNRGHFERN